ncbi:MAG: tyrosine--tRNA ligase [Dehalococcoides mccartyi]|uniref:tyrosine--tRNA ligase n=1 Tax=Dehalococcoides mccartyi TaxID=61435 RepID=UPI0030F88A48
MNQAENRIDQILKRGVAEVIVEEDFKKLLLSGKKLRLKEGFDPSSPDIHLGHMVALRKLRQLQDLGHQVVLIVGDWTAQIGDPSGASVTRPMLSAEQVKANAKTYLEQFFKIVDRDKTEVRWQSEWYANFKLEDVVRLSSKFTVAQMLARDDFAKRYAARKPISVTELLYPMLQAYDSVMVKSDVEFGGTDQKFNLLVGRVLQEMLGQKPQQVLMVPILVGTDGVHKMSKSLGNYIGVAEEPAEIFGKCMSIPDELILQYFELVTDIPATEIDDFKNQMANGLVNPMVLKKRLARELITQLYSATAAEEADAQFTRVVQRGEIPEDMPECHLENGESICVIDFIIKADLAKSKSEARRLLEQGGVEINSAKISDPGTTVKCGDIIKAGKRRYSKAV